YSPSTILEDAKKHGVEVRAVCIRQSAWDCTVEDGAIRVGLRQVKGLGKASGLRIEAARGERAFASIDDLAERAGLARDELDARVFDRLRHVATTSAMLTSHGRIERDGDVVYVVVRSLERLTIAADGAVPSMSRDFH